MKVGGGLQPAPQSSTQLRVTVLTSRQQLSHVGEAPRRALRNDPQQEDTRLREQTHGLFLGSRQVRLGHSGGASTGPGELTHLPHLPGPACFPQCRSRTGSLLPRRGTSASGTCSLRRTGTLPPRGRLGQSREGDYRRRKAAAGCAGQGPDGAGHFPGCYLQHGGWGSQPALGCAPPWHCQVGLAGENRHWLTGSKPRRLREVLEVGLRVPQHSPASSNLKS